MEITKDSSINEILKAYPESAKVFDKYNMACMGCMGASAESVENGALMHGLDATIIVEELRKITGQKPTA
jgi:hybrid cluster-associated redox disulfide protein